MPSFSGTFSLSSLAEVMRMLVNTSQTGWLEISQDRDEGFLFVENGMIVAAVAEKHGGLHALFQFVVWREASFKFIEQPIPADVTRELAVYDPQVLIEGVARKVDELAALQQAIPSLETTLYYTGAEALAKVEATPADLGLLILADGHRSVGEIAAELKVSPLEAARTLARFRLAGVLELVPSKNSSLRPALAAAS